MKAPTPDGGQLVKYDAMCRAIDSAYAVDEVKDIRDKAMAFEAYAKQAKNTEAERRACEIRLRAERKAGQLLSKMEKAKATPGNQHTGPLDRPEGSTPTLKELGVSHDQSSRWQQLADVPEPDFEAALAGNDKPSTAGIINGARPKQAPMDEDALWLWGRLRDFEATGIITRDFGEVLGNMTAPMRADVLRLRGTVASWLREKTQ